MAEQFIEQQVAEFARRYPTAAAIPAAKDAPAPVKKASAGPVAKEAETRPNVIQLECTNFAKQRKRHPDDNIASSDSDTFIIADAFLSSLKGVASHFVRPGPDNFPLDF
jgi:hypothetical protein